MSLVIAHLDPLPEPQDGEATIVLSLTVATPERQGDPEGWRARAVCAETDRVVGRWMSDCPLSAAQSALLWLGLNPWEVVPGEEGFDYADVLEKVDHPADNSDIHIRDLLDRIATNLPSKPSEVRNAATGARVLRRPPRVLLPPPEPEPEEAEEPEEDPEAGSDEAEDEAEAQAEAEAEARRNRLLQKALVLAQQGRNPDQLAEALTKKADASLAETFRVALAAVRPPPRPVSTGAAPALSPEAEAEIARYAVADEGAVRAKLERTQARAAREHARVQAHLAQRPSPAPAAPAAPVAPVALDVTPASVAEAPAEAPVPASKPKGGKGGKRGQAKLQVVSSEAAG